VSSHLEDFQQWQLVHGHGARTASSASDGKLNCASTWPFITAVAMRTKLVCAGAFIGVRTVQVERKQLWGYVLALEPSLCN
jgi:hypothetical protein